MTRFRGHHLICLHFFHGEGYNPEFVDNLRETLRVSEKEGVEVCVGSDDICKKCPYLKQGRCQHDDDADEEVKEMDDRALDLLNLGPGMRVGWQEIGGMLQEVFHEWAEAYCAGCDWEGACERNNLYQQLKAKSTDDPDYRRQL